MDTIILAVLAHYGADVSRIRLTGGWQPICCPFHGDEHQSASVDVKALNGNGSEVGAFKCHGCGMSGDSISLVMKNEEISFYAAYSRAKELAQDFSGAVQPEPVQGGRLSGRPRSFTRVRGW